MLQRARAAAGDDWDVDRLGDRARQLYVVAGQGAVGVHTGEQYLARAQRHTALRPLDRVDLGRHAPAVGIDFPAAVAAPRVDRQDDALAAEALGALRDQLRARDRGRVHADFIG